MMRGDDRPTNGQSDAQAMAFRSEEWLENLTGIAIRQAASLIRYRYTHSSRLRAGGYPKSSIPRRILRHRITGIGDDVQQDLLELHLVNRHMGQPFRELTLGGHSTCDKVASEQVQHILDDRIECQWKKPCFPSLEQGTQSRDHLSGTEIFADDIGKNLSQLRDVRGIPGQHVLGCLRIAQDNAQRLV